MAIPRRVYRPELRAALGYGATWFRMQQRRGVIPTGHRDPGSKKEWWTEDEARAIVDRMTAESVSAAA